MQSKSRGGVKRTTYMATSLLLDGFLEDGLALAPLDNLIHLVCVWPLPRHCKTDTRFAEQATPTLGLSTEESRDFFLGLHENHDLKDQAGIVIQSKNSTGWLRLGLSSERLQQQRRDCTMRAMPYAQRPKLMGRPLTGICDTGEAYAQSLGLCKQE